MCGGSVEPETNQPLGLLAHVKIINGVGDVGQTEYLIGRYTDEIPPNPTDNRVKITENHPLGRVSQSIASRTSERFHQRVMDRFGVEFG